MADFKVFFKTLLKHEGGYVNDPDDPGGATNKGVTFAVFKRYAKPLLGIEPTLDNLKNLTDEQAGKIYKVKYWDRVQGDDIESQDLANIVFDFYVNAGSNAVKLLQKVLNEMGANLVVDGGFGPSTMEALKKVNEDEVYMRYKEGRKEYYKRLCERKPVLKKFLKGWMNRVNSFPDIEVNKKIEAPELPDLSEIDAVKVREKGTILLEVEEETKNKD